MRSIVTALSALLGFIGISTLAASQGMTQSSTMAFVLKPSGTIEATGSIRSSTASEFRSFLENHGRLGSEWQTELTLNSPGGTVGAAMQLGRLIRQHRISTNVIGPCASACTLMAAGGFRRRVSDGGWIGVHQFTFADQPDGHLATDMAQRLAAEIDEYLEEMGIHRAFSREAMRTAARTIRPLSRDELQRFRFVTEPSAPSHATVAPVVALAPPSTPPFAPQRTLNAPMKILFSVRAGDGTIISIRGINSDRAEMEFRRERDDLEEDCTRNRPAAAAPAIARCVDAAMRALQGRIYKRRAFCSRNTVYTEFGNFSAVNWEREPSIRMGERSVVPIRTDWKNHRTEQIIGNCSACGTPVLIATFRALCPQQFEAQFRGGEPY